MTLTTTQAADLLAARQRATTAVRQILGHLGDLGQHVAAARMAYAASSHTADAVAQAELALLDAAARLVATADANRALLEAPNGFRLQDVE